jgi:hypothetical protein
MATSSTTIILAMPKSAVVRESSQVATRLMSIPSTKQHGVISSAADLDVAEKGLFSLEFGMDGIKRATTGKDKIPRSFVQPDSYLGAEKASTTGSNQDSELQMAADDSNQPEEQEEEDYDNDIKS